jgi:predicted transposase/invertase (TIGR01784 family)
MRAEKAVNGISRTYMKAIREMAIEKNRLDRGQELYERREEGRAEGRADEKLEIARKMKAMGDSAERIQTITGLPPETIEQL